MHRPNYLQDHAHVLLRLPVELYVCDVAPKGQRVEGRFLRYFLFDAYGFGNVDVE